MFLSKIDDFSVWVKLIDKNASEQNKKINYFKIFFLVWKTEFNSLKNHFNSIKLQKLVQFMESLKTNNGNLIEI